jgi:hypothetical protein
MKQSALKDDAYAIFRAVHGLHGSCHFANTEQGQTTGDDPYSIFGNGVDQSRESRVDFSSRKIHIRDSQKFTVFPKMP